MFVRERPPLRLSVNVETSDSSYRWAEDAHQREDVFSDLQFSDTMPGGFETCSTKLSRDPAHDYPDLQEFATLTVTDPGGECAWQGRIEGAPRTSGSEMAITPSAVGWQAALEDRKDVRALYVDISLTGWQAPSTERQAVLDVASADVDGPSVSTDETTGQPALNLAFRGPWDRTRYAEGLYDAKGLPISSVYYAWKKTDTIVITDPWLWYVVLADNDTRATEELTANLVAAGPGSGTLTATTSTRTFAGVQLGYPIAAGADNVDYKLFWTMLAVYGETGLTKRGTEGFSADVDGISRWHAKGYYASDIVQHAVSQFAPLLATSRAGASTIQESSFVIPQAVWLDATTASEIIKSVSRFDLPDWGVWEGPTFWWGERDGRARNWRARVGPSGLQETGMDASRSWNSVVVEYQDVSGVKRTAGPPSSGADVESANLVDSDPQNPCTLAGLTRRAYVSMGTTTIDGAIKIGQTFLETQRQLPTAGQAKLTGHVEDDHGILFPAWKVRAGDLISFTDANDTSYRRIVKKSYSHSDKSIAIDLDQPPGGLDALLERMSVAIAPLGF